MRGLLLRDRRLECRDDLAAPAAARGSVRVRVLRAGICATDLALARGYMGFAGTPGHEFVGVAAEGALAGRRVVGEINAACGECETCRAGRERHCPRRTVLGILRHGGAFAEELVLPERNLHPVPDAVSTDAATFTEPLAAAFEIGEQLELAAGTSALVAGDGKLGLLCAWVLHLHGLRVTVAGRHPERAELLPDAVAHRRGLLEADAGDHRTGVRRADAGGASARRAGEATEPFDLAVEATGHPDVLPRLLPLVRPRGTVVLKTTSERPATLDTSLVVVNELTLLGSRCGPFAPALRALAAGEVPVERLIAARFPLERAAEAFALAARPGVLKVLLDVGQQP